MSISQLQEFFDCCVGSWTTERTYHYLNHQEVERSRTEFIIKALNPGAKLKVLLDNQRPPHPRIEMLPGYELAFNTVSEKGDKVSQQLNMLFVPHQLDAPILEGDYLRDKAYEEAKPMVAHFRYDPATKELLMTTRYTRATSVDSITLVNPNLRIRKILNYQPVPEGQALTNLLLVGFGVEQKKV